MHTPSDSHNLNTALGGPTPPDIFSKLSDAIPDLRPLDPGEQDCAFRHFVDDDVGGARSFENVFNFL